MTALLGLLSALEPPKAIEFLGSVLIELAVVSLAVASLGSAVVCFEVAADVRGVAGYSVDLLIGQTHKLEEVVERDSENLCNLTRADVV